MSEGLRKLDRNTDAGVAFWRDGERRYACGCGTESEVVSIGHCWAIAQDHGSADAHCTACRALAPWRTLEEVFGVAP